MIVVSARHLEAEKVAALAIVTERPKINRHRNSFEVVRRFNMREDSWFCDCDCDYEGIRAGA